MFLFLFFLSFIIIFFDISILFTKIGKDKYLVHIFNILKIRGNIKKIKKNINRIWLSKISPRGYIYKVGYSNTK